jgi:hypothetical protein
MRLFALLSCCRGGGLDLSRDRLITYLVLLAVLLNVLNLMPVLDSPYLGDDAWLESPLRGTLALTGMDLAQTCWNVVKDYVRDGRWYPLVVYYFAAFYYLDRYSYKALEILFVITNILLFGYLVNLLTRSRHLALMALALAPLFFQLRFYHDPILSYYYLMQVELLFIEVSLIFFILYLRRLHTAHYCLSILAFTIVVLVYEAFYAFCLMFFVVAYIELGREAGRRILRLAAPFVALTAVNAGIGLVIRSLFHPRYEGITLNVDPWAWMLAYVKQVTAAIPLSYFFLGDHSRFAVDFAGAYFSSDLIAFCCLWIILWCFIWDHSRQEPPTESHDRKKRLILLGMGFWLLPPVLVSLSTKYQRELKWGLAYLPVYVSGFGMLMLTLAAVAALHDSVRNWSLVSRRLAVMSFAVLATALAGINYTNNRIVIQAYSCAEHFPRLLMERALASNLLGAVQEGSYLVFGFPLRSWDEPAFYRMHSGLALQVVKPFTLPMDRELGTLSYREAFSDYALEAPRSVYDFRNATVPRFRFAGYNAEFVGSEGVSVRRRLTLNTSFKRPDFFFLKYESPSKGLGYAVMGRLRRLKSCDGSNPEISADKLRVYVGIPIGTPYKSIVLTGNWVDGKSCKTCGVFRFTEKNLKLRYSDIYGKLFEVPKDLMRQCVAPGSVVATLSMTDE